jgi:hypothetical protein
MVMLSRVEASELTREAPFSCKLGEADMLESDSSTALSARIKRHKFFCRVFAAVLAIGMFSI